MFHCFSPFFISCCLIPINPKGNGIVCSALCFIVVLTVHRTMLWLLYLYPTTWPCTLCVYMTTLVCCIMLVNAHFCATESHCFHARQSSLVHSGTYSTYKYLCKVEPCREYFQTNTTSASLNLLNNHFSISFLFRSLLFFFFYLFVPLFSLSACSFLSC